MKGSILAFNIRLNWFFYPEVSKKTFRIERDTLIAAQRQVNWIRIQLANYSSAVLKQQTLREDDVEDTRSNDASPLRRDNNNYSLSTIKSFLDTASPHASPFR